MQKLNFGWYDAFGHPESHPIIFIHGVQVNRKFWLPQLHILSDEFRVLAPDLPGHGVLIDSWFDMGRALSVIDEIVWREGLNYALIVGLSLGGYVAMEYANRRSQRVLGLVLSGCSGIPRGFLTFPYYLQTKLIEWGFIHTFSRIKRQRLLKYLSAEIAVPILDHGINIAVLPDAFAEIVGIDFRKKIAKFTGRILFLNGKRDFYFRMHERKYLAAAQNAELEIINNAGHLVNLDQPEAYSRAIRKFAKSIYISS